MKKFIIVISLLSLIGCTSETKYGKCVGAFEKQDPKKEYNLDATNLIVGLLFFEFVAPPVLVIVNETFCPINNK